jgi:hypothetical protein
MVILSRGSPWKASEVKYLRKVRGRSETFRRKLEFRIQDSEFRMKNAAVEHSRGSQGFKGRVPILHSSF